MVGIGGKKVGEIVGKIGGNGVGQVLVAVAAALFVRLFSGPGPVLFPESDFDDENSEFDDSGESPVDRKVFPVTIRWSNITCSLSDKKSKSVSSLILIVLQNICILCCLNLSLFCLKLALLS